MMLLPGPLAALLAALLLLALCAPRVQAQPAAAGAAKATTAKNASAALPAAAAARPTATKQKQSNASAAAAPLKSNATAALNGTAAANGTAANSTGDDLTQMRNQKLVVASARDAAAWLRARAPRNATGPARFDVCVGASQPYAVCDENDPDTRFSGFEIELFREAALRVRWLGAEGEKWRFKCMGFSAMIDNIEAPNGTNGTCLLALGGLLSNHKVATDSSVSYMDKGFAILMLAHRDERKKLFSPFLAFSWQLWLALITTAVVVSGILWLLDTSVRAMDRDGVEEDDGGSDKDHHSSEDCPFCRACGVHGKLCKQPSTDMEGGLPVPGTLRPQFSDAASTISSVGRGRPIDALLELLHRAHGQDGIKSLKALDETLRVVLLNLARAARTPSTSTLPSQLVLWAWGLLTMITISMFTGATAAALTTSALSGGVRRLSDLRGKPVIVYEHQVRRFNSTGIVTLPYPWENIQDEEAMVRDLRAHKAAAIVMDSNWAEFQAGTNCDLVIAGEPWMERFVAFRWHLNTSDTMVDELDAAIKALKEEGVIADLRERLVTSPSSGCSEKSLSKATTVEFGQVAGLWVILALAVLAALLMSAFLFVTRRIRRRHREQLRTTISRASLRLQSRAGVLPRGSGKVID